MGSESDFALDFFALEELRPESESDPNFTADSTPTARSAWMRVKPLADNHWVSSSAVVLAGNSTGKVNTSLGDVAPTLAASRAALPPGGATSPWGGPAVTWSSA